jgi:excisionase family DNA binding protein
MPRQHPTDPPTTPEEAEQYARLYTLKEAAQLLGKHRQQLQRWITSGAIHAHRDDSTGRGTWLISGAQLGAIWRKPQRPPYVVPMDLAKARERYGHKLGAR